MTATLNDTALIDELRQVYVDAIPSTLSDYEVYKRRSLHWHGQRVSLADAVEAFALIEDGYNAFNSETLAKLQAEFPDAGIQVTPAREGSVAVYLYIPDGLKDRVKAFILEFLSADEVAIVTQFSCLQPGEPELVGEALRVWWD